MKRIKLENFRCYKEQTIDFKPGINLLIGDNASGKTSILKACKYVLSSFFAGFKDENTPRLSIQNSDFRQVIENESILPEAAIKISFDFRDLVVCTQISEVRENSATPFFISKASRINSTSIKGISIYKKLTKQIYDTFYNLEESKRDLAIPLYAAFSTEDIHSTRKLNAKIFKQYNQKSSFGYYECLDGDGFFKYWLSRLIILEEGQKGTEEIEIVKSTIVKALGEDGCNIIRDVIIRPKQGGVYFIFADDREVEAQQLSDGYKRIVNIVLDLAFRCAILNRTRFGLQSSTKTSGTVLIDEIDLHLHPTLQSTILKGLRNAFPKLQFIITSHAPMIMSSVESNGENVVYKLDYSNEEGYSVNEVVTYGMDLSTISETILEQPARNEVADNELSELFDMIDDNRDDEAIAKLNQLRLKYKNIPDLSRAEAMLNCRIYSDEENL